MRKQKIRIFDANNKYDLEKEVNNWLNNKNNENIRVINISASNKNQYGGYIIVIHYEFKDDIN